MPTSVRLDEHTEQLLRQLANRNACSKSAIIRRAIEMLAADAGLGDRPPRPHELIGDLIGCASGGPSDLSTRTGARFASLIAAKRGAES